MGRGMSSAADVTIAVCRSGHMQTWTVQYKKLLDPLLPFQQRGGGGGGRGWIDRQALSHSCLNKLLRGNLRQGTKLICSMTASWRSGNEVTWQGALRMRLLSMKTWDWHGDLGMRLSF